MSVMTNRLPDAKHARLKKELARSRGLSTTKLREELATVALVQQGMAGCLAMRSRRADAVRGFAILDELGDRFAKAV